MCTTYDELDEYFGLDEDRILMMANRYKVLERDNYTCQMVGKKDDSANYDELYGDSKDAFLKVHHKIPKDKGGRSTLDNLITICKDCHAKIHPWLKKLVGRKMGRLDWNKVRKLQCRQKKTKTGKVFHVERVTDRAVIVRPKGKKPHRVSRRCLEKAVNFINRGGVLNGPGDYKRKICDDKPSYAWAILRNLNYV